MHPQPGRQYHGAPVPWRRAGELEAFQDVIGSGDQSQMLSRLVSRVASLDKALAEAEMRRRALHNQLVELRGNVCCL